MELFITVDRILISSEVFYKEITWSGFDKAFIEWHPIFVCPYVFLSLSITSNVQLDFCKIQYDDLCLLMVDLLHLYLL